MPIRPRVEEDVKCAKIFEEKERQVRGQREKGNEETFGKHAQRHFRVSVILIL